MAPGASRDPMGFTAEQAAVTAEERHRPRKDRVSGELPFPLEAIGLGADEPGSCQSRATGTIPTRNCIGSR
jgi:hypothetical protein